MEEYHRRQLLALSASFPRLAQLARFAVHEHGLHPPAVIARAVGVPARDDVHEKVSDPSRLLLLDLASLVEVVAAQIGDPDYRVLMPVLLVALIANVEIGTGLAPETPALLDVLVANVARAHEAGRRRVVKMVENHHAAVLRAPEGIELIMCALAQRQKRFAGVENLALHLLVRILDLRQRRLILRDEILLLLRRQLSVALLAHAVVMIALERLVSVPVRNISGTF